MVAMQETIRTSGDLENHYNEISKICNDNSEAVIITVNGKEDTVAIFYEEYKRMKSRKELLEMLAECEDDVKNDRTSPIKDTFKDLKKILEEK